MKIKFDYLQGPVLGHKRRCELLVEALSDRGHEVGQNVDPPDLLVVDYPEEQFPKPVDETPRLLMGTLPKSDLDWSWHPLGAEHPRSLSGAKYLIIDQRLAHYENRPKIPEILVTCGGADPFHVTESVLRYLNLNDIGVVIGPNFGREVSFPSEAVVYYNLPYEEMMAQQARYATIVCTWGNTTFESCYLGARVVPITLYPEHDQEAERLGIRYVNRNDLTKFPKLLKAVQPNRRYGIDLRGLDRLCHFVESGKWGVK